MIINVAHHFALIAERFFEQSAQESITIDVSHCCFGQLIEVSVPTSGWIGVLNTSIPAGYGGITNCDTDGCIFVFNNTVRLRSMRCCFFCCCLLVHRLLLAYLVVLVNTVVIL